MHQRLIGDGDHFGARKKSVRHNTIKVRDKRNPRIA